MNKTESKHRKNIGSEEPFQVRDPTKGIRNRGGKKSMFADIDALDSFRGTKYTKN